MRIIAIDPGKCTGWAVGGRYLEASGTFDPDIPGLLSPRELGGQWLGCKSVEDGNRVIRQAFEHALAGRSIYCNIPAQLTCGCDHLIYEFPRLTKVGPGTFQNRADNLVVLCLRLGRIVRQIPHKNRIEVYPQAWKGQVPKGIHNRRVLAELTLDELTVASRDHNAIDAIGLYQYARKHLHT
jgi:hypothetical protein